VVQDPSFKEAMSEAKRYADPRGQSYGSFLLLPVQRMASLVNATAQLNKHTPEGHVDKCEIITAQSGFEEAAGMVDQSALWYKDLERLERGCVFTAASIGGSWVVPGLYRKILHREAVGVVVEGAGEEVGDMELVIMSDVVMLLSQSATDDRLPGPATSRKRCASAASKQAVEHSFHISQCSAHLAKPPRVILFGDGFSYTLRASNPRELCREISQATEEARRNPLPNPLEPLEPPPGGL